MTVDDLDRSRAEAVANNIRELNVNSTGHTVQADPLHILQTDPAFFLKFNMVIATQLPDTCVVPLANLLYSHSIPFLNVKSNGLIGYARLAVPEHTSMFALYI